MRKLLSLLLALCLVCSFVGCGAGEDAAEKASDEVLFEKTGFSITLPVTAEDVSKSDTANVDPFVFAVDGITICAMEQYKVDFGTNMSAEAFANILIEANAFESAVELKNGVPTFTFHSAEDNLTYLAITKVTDSSYWYINASCDPEVFQENYDTMWKYLVSAQPVSTEDVLLAAEVATYQTITVEDLTMQLPTGFKDLTEEWDTGATFTYMVSDDNALMATREEKSAIAENVESLEYYCNNLIVVNELDSTVKDRNGIPYFTYKSEDGAFTYLVTAYEGTDSYWYMQSYTETAMFSLLEERLWSYLETVQIA